MLPDLAGRILGELTMPLLSLGDALVVREGLVEEDE